jgi:hypothetical protein
MAAEFQAGRGDEFTARCDRANQTGEFWRIVAPLKNGRIMASPRNL